MFRILYPKMYVSSVHEIKPGRLQELGLKAILLDLDNTIIRRDAFHFSPAVSSWLSELRSLGIKMCIVSNNSPGRVGSIAGLMDLPAVDRALKPLGMSFHRAMKLIGTSPGETALVGDQIFTDILGGNLTGLYTILVVPMKGKEFWGTRLINRPLERFVLARLKKCPEVFYGKWD